MKILPVIVVMALLGIRALAADPTFESLAPHESQIRSGSYDIDLGEADDPKVPRAWKGPIRIQRPDGQTCQVKDDVAIMEQPMAMVQKHLLYVTTYSGSEVRVYVVDADDCKVKWSSRKFEGTPKLDAKALILPQSQPLPIGENGLPVI